MREHAVLGLSPESLRSGLCEAKPAMQSTSTARLNILRLFRWPFAALTPQMRMVAKKYRRNAFR
ncbi:hypothetical protein AKG43_03875 [Neisseria sp. 74A18]|nr:hypothetical protein AKG43_03875 [Neisseria sp. 74A18]